MSDEVLQRILDTTARVEGKLDTHLEMFHEHVRADERLASDVHRLAKQRGYITVSVAAVATAAGYLASKIFGIRF
jgi:hypothetical protein